MNYDDCTRIEDKKLNKWWKKLLISGINDDITAAPAGTKNTTAWAADDAPVIPAITTKAAIPAAAIAFFITSCYYGSA